MSGWLRRHSPFLASLRGYRRAWLGRDLAGGLTVVALLLPEGMAYAQLAGVPPQAAFFVAPIGMVMYALAGSSRQMVVAVSAPIAALSAATVGPLAPVGSPRYLALTAALAMMAGLIGLAAGALRLGRINQFFSSSVLTGFVFGLALVIAAEQLPKLLGLPGGEGDFFQRLWSAATHLRGANLLTLAVGAASMLLLVVFEAHPRRFPGPLLVLVLGIAAAALFGLQGRGVKMVGHVEGGLALPRWPGVGLADAGRLLPGAFSIALVGFAEAIGPARLLAARHGYSVDPNREIAGLGAANLGAGLFQGFSIGASLSKTSDNEGAGARTQLSAIFAAGLMLLVARFLMPTFWVLPEATLAAIVVFAVSRMMDVKEVLRLWRLRRADFLGAAVALVGPLVLDLLPGLLLAVGVSIFLTVRRATRPRISELGRSDRALAFISVDREPSAVVVPGLLILRPSEGVFFGNASALHGEVVRRVEQGREAHTVLLDLGYTADLDVPGADMLGALHGDLEGRGVRLWLAGASAELRDMLERTGVAGRVGRKRIYRLILDGVEDFLALERPGAPEEWALIRDGLDRVRQIVGEVELHAHGRGRRRADALRERLAGMVEDLGRDG